MTLSEYQERAMHTCLESSKNFSYMFLNLVGEIGEFASKVAKHIRKDEMSIRDNFLPFGGITIFEGIDPDEEGGRDFLTVIGGEEEEALRKELGDCLWQLSGLCSVLDYDLEDIAKENLYKLASRKRRNVIDGDGDNR